jgi:hypothetical protein
MKGNSAGTEPDATILVIDPYSTLMSQWVHIHIFPHNDSCSSPSKVLGGENVQDLDVRHFGGQVLHIGLSVDQSVPLPITTFFPSSVSNPHIILATYRIIEDRSLFGEESE